MKNYVKEIYKTFGAISTKIAELLKPKNSTAEVVVSIEVLKICIYLAQITQELVFYWRLSNARRYKGIK